MIHNPKQATKPHKKLKQKEIKEGQRLVAHNKICENHNCSYEFVKNQIDPSAVINKREQKTKPQTERDKTEQFWKKLNIANRKIEHGKFMILANQCKELWERERERDHLHFEGKLWIWGKGDLEGDFTTWSAQEKKNQTQNIEQ